MTAEEETALTIAADAGDQTAYKELIEANSDWSSRSPIGMRPGASPLDNLVDAGNGGIVRAVRRFDPSERRAFAEVAMQYIEQAVSAAVA